MTGPHPLVATSRQGAVHGLIWPGSGPRLVLLHGAGLNAAAWAPVARSLSPRYACAALDLPGHGAAPAALHGWDPVQIADLLLDGVRASALDPVVVIGHSLGAAVASIMAANGGAQRVRGLVNLDGWGCFDLPLPAAHRDHAALRAYAASLDAIRGSRGTLLRRLIAEASAAGFTERDVKPVVERRLALDSAGGARHRPDGRSFLAAVLALDALNLEPAYRRLTIPTLLVNASVLPKDPEVTADELDVYRQARARLSRRLSANPFVTVVSRRWGHDFPLRRPTATAALIDAFVAHLPGDGEAGAVPDRRAEVSTDGRGLTAGVEN